MSVFVDTSALYALIDADDARHEDALSIWQQLAGRGEDVVTHNYVLLETTALVQRRIGMQAVRALNDDLCGPINVIWIGDDIHRAGLTSLLARNQRDLSLVDWVSFEVMRRMSLDVAFAFDPDFRNFGFRTLP